MSDVAEIPEAAPSGDPPKRVALTPERIREIGERNSQKARERDQKASEQARERKKQSLLSDRQLTLWVDAVRGAPNEIVRSALFTAKNRKQAREDLKRVNGCQEALFSGCEGAGPVFGL